MNSYKSVCAIILRFAGLLSVLVGIFGFVSLAFIFLIPNYSEKYTIAQAVQAGIFYTALGVIVFLLSKPLAKLICMNLED